MGLPSIKISRSFGDIAEVEPAVNIYAFTGYEKVKMTKSGYLWVYYTIALVEGLSGKLTGQKLGFIGKGFQIESMHDRKIVLKKPKKGRVLYSEMFKNKTTGSWEKEKFRKEGIIK